MKVNDIPPMPMKELGGKNEKMPADYREDADDASRQKPIFTINDERMPSENNSAAKMQSRFKIDNANGVTQELPITKKQSAMALYEDDYDGARGQKVGHMLRRISLYRTTGPTSEEADEKPKQAAKMGTFMGVFLPCLQNIFGVIFFIRLAWIVGTAGIVQAFLVILTCVSVTFLTSISLSAIATNGVVPAGGPYYMISRNLGPELGGAVGILFYLGTTVAAAMYITGAIEIMILYIAPEMKLFPGMYNNFRLMGSIILVILGCIVLSGVRVVNKFALPLIVILCTCAISSLAGSLIRFNGSDSLQYCMVGDRPVDLIHFYEKTKMRPNCTAEGLEPMFCKDNGTCDPYFNIMKDVLIWKETGKPAIRNEPAIRGISSGVFFDNLWPKHLRKGYVISKNPADRERKTHDSSFYIYTPEITSFMILIGVFFPSATGIMAGSNRSGNLKDPAKSIPIGTLAAQNLTSIIYMIGVFLIGSSVSDIFLRDKFGSSAFGKLIISELAWPFPTVILFGSFFASIGAGMQSLTGAPRLLQAIAADNVVPFLKPFQKVDGRGEPLRAIFLTICICEVGILIAVLESLTALITQFFLMCYLGVNASCALQSLLKSPGWRPGFRHYHWSLSFIGAILCVAIMFISEWHFALIAISIGIAVYKYIEYVGAEKEWGDGIRGLKLSAARYALLSLDGKPQHSRNWRPQLLVLMDEIDTQKAKGMLHFVSQLKAGKGLTLVALCAEGDFAKQTKFAEVKKQELCSLIQKHKIKGFSDVLITKNILEGISCLVQTSGLGGLRHNAVMVGWPEDWKDVEDGENPMAENFVHIIRTIMSAGCAIMVAKNTYNYPAIGTKIAGTVDVWWVVHDGGLLMLLPFLLRQHKVWKNTNLRLFAIAHIEDDDAKMKKDLEKFLYHLRIEAKVNVIKMTDSDISEYTYERARRLDRRNKRLASMNEEEKSKDIQSRLYDLTRRTINKIDNASAASIAYKFEKSFQESSLNSVKNGQHKDDETSSTDEAQEKKYNIEKMHTAVKLNDLMKSKSGDAQMIFVNLPAPPRPSSDVCYMEFIEMLTEGLHRVVLVRGTGAEVVTIYS